MLIIQELIILILIIMETKAVVNKLKSEGAKEVVAKVKNVTVTVEETYTRVALTLDKEVDGYRQNDEGNWEKGKTNVIFTSLFALIAMLKENDDAAFAANHLLKHPDAMSVVMSRSEVTVLQEAVTSGQVYKSPWSENAEERTFDHDTIINHVVDIKLSDFGIRSLDKLVDRLLGF